MTALLMVYAILVIASSIFWVWFALSKSRLIAGNYRANDDLRTDLDKMKQVARLATDKATELTGGVTDDVKADGQSSDIMKSNDLESTQNGVTD